MCSRSYQLRMQKRRVRGATQQLITMRLIMTWEPPRSWWIWSTTSTGRTYGCSQMWSWLSAMIPISTLPGSSFTSILRASQITQTATSLILPQFGTASAEGLGVTFATPAATIPKPVLLRRISTRRGSSTAVISTAG